MYRVVRSAGLVWLWVSLATVPSAFGREASFSSGDKGYRGMTAQGSPVHCLVAHRVGRIELGVANNGSFGNYYHPGPNIDWFTGEDVPSCEYPRGSNITYLYGAAFWIGAVVGRDTLVSVGADGWDWIYELYPDEAPFGEMVYRSITDPTQPEYEGAVSEEDYIAVYTDTFTGNIPADVISGRPHTPLDIEVTQASYAWSYSYAEDFVLFDYQIKSIGDAVLNNVYMGIYVDADVGFDVGTGQGAQDDICGFLHTYPSTYGACEYVDTVFIAWIADNDGDLSRTHTDGQIHPCPHVTATRIVRTPSDSLDVSFNWWIGNMDPAMDYGPRERPGVGRWQEPYRDFGTSGLGTPSGDANKYYVMRNQEFDYDQVYSASIQPNDELWMYPNQEVAQSAASGMDTRYFLSFGPFEIRPGQTLPISFAYVAGEDFHSDDNNLANLPGDPDAFYDNLDFSDLALNATWASWIYDNPGVDTDENGDSGKMRICYSDSMLVFDTVSTDPLVVDTSVVYTVADTFWYEGDGVPDFRGASPPPAPTVWVEPEEGSLRVRFNGRESETTRDVFSRMIDFEGYRVYLARDERSASYGVLASYDLEDYNKLVYTARTDSWVLQETPFTIEELRCLYGDSCNDSSFDPLEYSRTRPYSPSGFPDSQFYFEAQDYNVSEPGVTTPIRKRFPEATYPSSLDPLEAQPEELTGDGYFKYFEYEFLIDNLLPSVPYWVSVTAFDFGSPQSGLASLETAVTFGAKTAYALPGWDAVEADDLKVYVYPNPYRVDANYRDRGFEGRVDSDRPPDRTRLLHFANLPPRCTIGIYTLDGDLVREIEHTGTPYECQETWDLITRNTQMVVSGIYYWTVEDHDSGEVQIGKVVVIM